MKGKFVHLGDEFFVKMYRFQADSVLRRQLKQYSETVLIVYSTTSGTSKVAATKLASSLETLSPTLVRHVQGLTLEELQTYDYVIVIISTITDGKCPVDAESFTAAVEDAAYDFRVDKSLLSKCKFAVVGLGCEHYGEAAFCTPAKRLDDQLSKLGGHRLSPLQLISDTQDLHPQLERVIQQISKALSLPTVEAIPAAQTIPEPDDNQDDPAEADVEENDGCASTEMVTDRQRAQLEKEGYKIIGTHSAVKLCRWTKHHARGRGGCYKHTFYGISSKNCMEATPSLACANKCVFCWRHHKNPVGTSWRWEMDDAGFIVNEAVTKHLEMIKQLRGVPGVTEEKFNSAMAVKHCALSLVGEPIMYPEINTLLHLLHERRISTFLVTNAQFPEAIRSLRPVTQLYVSIDACDPVSLKKVDRPLFADYWERFTESLRALKHKKQRTVYRLTLVKEYNMDEVKGYADLLSLGQPTFIEIKAVTYCGNTPGTSDLTMANVPWFEEVCKFAQALADEVSGDYEICCEHKHSCSVLLAQKRLKVDGVWHTWIDYDKFADLALSGKTDFGVEDYWATTPAWAVWGAQEQGFDPEETRVYRNKQ